MGRICRNSNRRYARSRDSLARRRDHGQADQGVPPMGRMFFPATAASVQVTVGCSEPKIKHTQPLEPAANHSSDSGAALGMQIGKDEQPQRLPAQHPIPVIQCSPRPNPVLREKGSPNCVHVFTIHAKNASGYNYMCRHCRQHWYRPWAEDEKQVQIKNRLCTAQVVTEVSLT